MKAMGAIGRSRGKGEKQRLEGIAMQAGVSRSYLCRVFKKTMGMTVGEYIREFEKEGEEFVDSVFLDAESETVTDAVRLSKDVGTESIGEDMPPDINQN